MWIIGGYGGGTTFYNDVWSSSDGSSWTKVTDNAGFSARYLHGAVAFKDRLWVIGGATSVEQLEGQNGAHTPNKQIPPNRCGGIPNRHHNQRCMGEPSHESVDLTFLCKLRSGYSRKRGATRYQQALVRLGKRYLSLPISTGIASRGCFRSVSKRLLG